MKICIINSFYYPDIVGGAEISVLKLAKQLSMEGNQVNVLCTGTQTKDELIDGIHVNRIKVNNVFPPIKMAKNKGKLHKIKSITYRILDIYNILNYKLLYDKLKEINPDVVHINNIDGISSIIWTVCNRLNIPLVQTLRDYSLINEDKYIKHKISKCIYSIASKEIKVITAPSEYTLNEFDKKGYFKNSKKRTIYNAIDFTSEEVIRVYDEKIQSSKHKKTIKYIYVGRLTESKGVVFLIDSFKKLKLENIELTIVGMGRCKKIIEDAVICDDRIDYKGFLNEDELKEELKKHDVLIIPSLWGEPFGRVIIEAYKYSIPVIGCKIGGIPEIIVHNKTGILITPNSVEELIKAISYFTDRQNINKMMKNCILELEKYNIQSQSKSFMKLYKSLIV